MSQAPAASIPSTIHNARDYEDAAARALSGPTYAYLAGGSGEDLTVAANRAAFAAWCIHPRLLADVSQGHTRVTLGEEQLPHPILLAPVAHQRLAHSRAELETARAAEATNTHMVCSTLSSFALEEIARASSGGKWFQLYLQPRREDTLALVERAQAAGYTQLMVTLDAPLQAASRAAARAGFSMPADCTPGNITRPAALPVPVPAGQSRIFQGAMREAPSWTEVDALLQNASMPLWAKGILHPGDALALKARGFAGLVVSNHGGRSLDGAPASLDVLPGIRAAVGTDYPLLLDGGVRSGSDVFKALALGADAVMVGRLQVYALAVAGALGVAHMLKLLREELELCMALAGCATPQAITRESLTAARLSGDNPAPC